MEVHVFRSGTPGYAFPRRAWERERNGYTSLNIKSFSKHLARHYHGETPAFAGVTSGIVALVLCFCALHSAQADVLRVGGFEIQFDASEVALAQETGRILTEAASEYAAHLPLGDEVVTVTIAHTLKEFRAYAPGLAQLNIAGFANGSKSIIVVKSPQLGKYDSDYRGTLRHELVHILLHRNVDTERLPRWLNEGLSMSLANELRWRSALVVGQQFMQGRIIDYHKLDGQFLKPGSESQFGDAYAQALSLTRFYRNTLGEEVFWKVLGGMKSMSLSEALALHSPYTESDLWGKYESSLWQWMFISTLSSGTVFAPAALLLVIAFFRKRRKGKALMAKWEREERAPASLAVWENFEEDGDAWKRGTEYEDEP